MGGRCRRNGCQVNEVPHQSPSDLPEGPSPRPHVPRSCSCHIDVHGAITAAAVDGMGTAAAAHPAMCEALRGLTPAHYPSCPTTEHGQHQARAGGGGVGGGKGAETQDLCGEV